MPKPSRVNLPEALFSSLETLSRRFSARGVDHAVIGGVAIALHGPPRATVDLDFLIAAESSTAAHEIMLDAGFEVLQREKVFAHYRLGFLRVDFLHTQGRHSTSMLARARPAGLEGTKVRVVQPEDLIGLKLQALANDATRPNDWGDIQSLLEQFHKQMDMILVREYFQIFGRETELDGLLAAIARRGS